MPKQQNWQWIFLFERNKTGNVAGAGDNCKEQCWLKHERNQQQRCELQQEASKNDAVQMLFIFCNEHYYEVKPCSLCAMNVTF